MKKITHLRILPRKYDFPLIASCVILSIIGVIFIGSANISSSLDVVNNVVKEVIKQTGVLLLAILICIFVSRFFSYKLMKNFFWVYTIGLMGALLLCLGFPSINDTHGWIIIGGFSVQPAEFAKIGIILAVATLMCNHKTNETFFKVAMAPIAIIFVYFIIIWRLQNDLGSATVCLLIGFCCCLIPYHPSLKKPQLIAKIGTIVLIVVISFVLSEPGIAFIESLGVEGYKLNRIITAVNPFADMYNSSFQVANSLIAFARGGWFGVGLGSSVQKFGYLPEASNDFIVAVIAEETGIMGLSIIFIIYGIIAYRLLRYAFLVKREENKVILIGATAYLFFHVLLNIGGATAFIPLTGVPLLMLSSGGSSLISWFILIGICEAIIAKYRRGEENLK